MFHYDSLTTAWELGDDDQRPLERARAPLAADESADVCIVGAGVSGLTTAYLMAREGLTTVVVDQGRIASGESGRTTAHLTHVYDTPLDDIVAKFDTATAATVWEGLAHAIDLIETIVSREGLDCDFARVPGTLYADSPEQSAKLEAIAKAASEIGMPGRRTLPAGLGFTPRNHLTFDRQARLHPRRYLLALAARLEDMGVRIYENTRVAEVSDAAPHRIVSETGLTITSERAVIAAHVPFNNRFVLHTKQAAYRTYAIGIRIPRGSFPDTLLWDMNEPYHYIRIQPTHTHDVLIVGGEDHKTGHGPSADPFDRLTAFATHRLHVIGEVLYRWSGQVMEPMDGLQFIGENPGAESELVATGYSGDGMTSGTLAAHIITERSVGRETKWDKLLNPGRLPVHGVKDFLKENVDFPANILTRHWKPEAEERPIASLHAGEGGIFKIGAKRFAISRRADGHIVALSPKCTHLGCNVHWNAVERSWDCPCHGSRYSQQGEVLNGPAHAPLAEQPLAEVLAAEERQIHPSAGSVSPGVPSAEDWVST